MLPPMIRRSRPTGTPTTRWGTDRPGLLQAGSIVWILIRRGQDRLVAGFVVVGPRSPKAFACDPRAHTRHGIQPRLPPRPSIRSSRLRLVESSAYGAGPLSRDRFQGFRDTHIAGPPGIRSGPQGRITGQRETDQSRHDRPAVGMAASRQPNHLVDA